MLKSVEKLINAYNAGRKKVTYGNHWMEVDEKEVNFYYHSTAVCTVNNKTGRAVYNNGGWNTSSTNRTISSYKSYFGN